MATQNKDVLFQKNVRFKPQEQTDYVLKLKKKRNWWWLLWLLLLPLLLIRCEHDVTVTCIDGRTKAPLPDIQVEIAYDSHFLYKDGVFLPSEFHWEDKITDVEGNAVFEHVETSVFSYIFYCLSQITATADDIATVTRLLHFTRHIVIELENIDCDVDIVMCIDDTGSMHDLIGMVRDNATSFCEDLSAYCKEHHRNVVSSRIKVVKFGDLTEKPLEESPMYEIQTQRPDFLAYMSKLDYVPDSGGDNPESGLEALAMAMQTDWRSSAKRLRHIIVLYTDAEAHPLEERVGEAEGNYPANMPRSLKELENLWDSMNQDARKLILFAPDEEPWNDIEEWTDVAHETDQLDEVLSGSGYQRVMATICKSL